MLPAVAPHDFSIARRQWWIGGDWRDTAPKAEFYRAKLTNETQVTVEFDYPLDVPHRMTFDVPADSTYATLAGLVADHYHTIYADPAKYQVWGHTLGDLVLEGAQKRPDGVWQLVIGS